MPTARPHLPVPGTGLSAEVVTASEIAASLPWGHFQGSPGGGQGERNMKSDHLEGSVPVALGGHGHLCVFMGKSLLS